MRPAEFANEFRRLCDGFGVPELHRNRIEALWNEFRRLTLEELRRGIDLALQGDRYPNAVTLRKCLTEGADAVRAQSPGRPRTRATAPLDGVVRAERGVAVLILEAVREFAPVAQARGVEVASPLWRRAHELIGEVLGRGGSIADAVSAASRLLEQSGPEQGGPL